MTADIRTAAERECVNCGKAYVPTSDTQKFCESMCKRENYMKRRFGEEYAAEWRRYKELSAARFTPKPARVTPTLEQVMDELRRHKLVHVSVSRARAALEAAARAAQGAAPQAETDRAMEIAHELAKVYTFTMADGEAIAGAALSLAVRALPSSGVDEEKLAEVIESHVLGDPNGGTASWARVNCSCGHRIEIAGVTREYVVALGRKHQARAVAEWLKEQGVGKD